MATARDHITGNRTAFLRDHSRGKETASRDCPPPLRRHTNGQTRNSKRTDSSQLALHALGRAAPEKLPRIILVSSDDVLMPELSQALEPCPLEIRSLKTCVEAGNEIGCCTTADVIFTEVRLSDGDWKQVLQMARKASARAEVILVSKFVDVRLYLDALEAGAFDFVVPPFHTVELGYIVVNAMYACFKQRTHRFSGNSPDPTAV